MSTNCLRTVFPNVVLNRKERSQHTLEENWSPTGRVGTEGGDTSTSFLPDSSTPTA